MRLRGHIACALAAVLLAPATPAAAQAVTTSERPQSVAVTVYRAPHRSPDETINLEWLNGYALVSETRQISIPAGESIVRFEGVAGGLMPESAIVTGFPEGVVERNQDAWLLSAASLLDRSLGRRVHIRRTSPTGQVREHEAVIRSGAGGAVVLQTAEGYEALRCSGLPETIVYPQVPQGLSARPTWSVRVRSAAPVTATVTLSYLATGFDWQANYVATLSPAGDRVDLFAWVTLASTDETSFPDAETQAVAGRLNRVDDPPRPPRERAELRLQCWPQGRTDQIPLEGPGPPPPPPPPPPPLMAPTPMTAVDEESIVVTGSRIARQEELGDLKLYRFPERVTVAANSQKQVAFLDRDDVRMRIVFRQRLDPTDVGSSSPALRVLVTRNRPQEGLGVPLPAGRLVLFAGGGERPILLGEGSMRDLAVGEDVEVELGSSPGVLSEIRMLARTDRWTDYELTVTNAQRRAAPFEAELVDEEGRLSSRVRLGRRNGRPLWAATVPANGRATLRYRVAANQRD